MNHYANTSVDDEAQNSFASPTHNHESDLFQNTLLPGESPGLKVFGF